MQRRSFLRAAPFAAIAALAAGARAVKAEPDPINVEYVQEYRRFPKIAPGVNQVVVWPAVSDDFPDSRGLLSASRTEVTLADPGVYLVSWAITFEAGPGDDRETALQKLDPADGLWHGAGDGNQMSKVRGQGVDGFGPNETTSVGSAWVRSDGATLIRLHVTHDSPRPLEISDRAYECHLHVAWWGR